MMTRRAAVLTALSTAGLALAGPASASDEGGAATYRVPDHLRPARVEVDPRMNVGVIYVFNTRRELYWVDRRGGAIRYFVAIGAPGRQFTGRARIARKAEWPGWHPTANLIRMEPHIYGRWPDGLPGGHPDNPLGARALYLHRGGRDTLYRIHGTPQPWTIGRAFSSGCIRLANAHVADLYARVPVGTRVVVV